MNILRLIEAVKRSSDENKLSLLTKCVKAYDKWQRKNSDAMYDEDPFFELCFEEQISIMDFDRKIIRVLLRYASLYEAEMKKLKKNSKSDLPF